MHLLSQFSHYNARPEVFNLTFATWDRFGSFSPSTYLNLLWFLSQKLCTLEKRYYVFYSRFPFCIRLVCRADEKV